MEDKENQESTPQAEPTEQAEPEKNNVEKESLDDIIKKTATEQPKDTGEKAEPTTLEKQPESKAKTETETVKTESLLPKDNFTADEKEYFNSLDDAGKKVMLKKWGNLESGYNKKYESIANNRKMIDEFNQIYEPYKQQLDIAGITPVQYTKQLIAADKFIKENPVEGIKWLAQNYSVDLATLNQTPEEQDPTTKELNSLKGEIGTLKQELSQRELTTLAKQIENFKNSKDEEGNLKYPHFDTVKNEMAKLNAATGETNLEALYSRAVRLNDDLYNKQLDVELAKKQAEAQKQADLNKAKKAGKPIKSSPSVKVSKNNKVSIDQILEEELS